jgi:hypothetical protein
MIVVFVRDRYEQYRFLGGTRQSYFIIHQSEFIDDKYEYFMLVIRHYSLETLDILNEQVLPLLTAFDCLQR